MKCVRLKCVQSHHSRAERVHDHEFSNGCRSPPWRQVHGEIAHLVIETCDTGSLYITCSTDGVFLNAGVGPDGDENSYDRKSQVFRDLVTLLKDTSPHFTEDIRKQVILLENKFQLNKHRDQKEKVEFIAFNSHICPLIKIKEDENQQNS
ncbi:outer dynein arm-docking complex subunit 2 isoform X1 [Tachysurus ichikawai]